MRPHGITKHNKRDDISHLARGPLGVPQEKLEEIAREKAVSAALLSVLILKLLPH